MAIRRESLRAPSHLRPRRDSSPAARPAHVAALVNEAHRLARRRATIEAACRRPAGDGTGRPMSEARRHRLIERGARLMLAFHAVLDRLFAADCFDEALRAFRAYASARDRGRDAGAAPPPPPGRHPGDGPPASRPDHAAAMRGWKTLDDISTSGHTRIAAPQGADRKCPTPMVGTREVATTMNHRTVIPARWHCRKAQHERARSRGRNCALPPPSVALISAAPPPPPP